MIITDSFVMINFPKTGSAFARKMLQQVHHGSNASILEKACYRLRIKKRPFFLVHEEPNIREVTHRRGHLDEHGIYIQIPKAHIHKKVISIKRNIYDRYISLYEFRNWEKSPWLDVEMLKNKFSNYPNISFKDFMHIILDHNPIELLPEVNKSLTIGPATAQFILFFFKEPFKTLKEIDDDYVKSDAYKKDISPVIFLDQANLNEELYKFLREEGYPKRKVKFILEAKKINNSTPKHKTRNDYFTPELYDLVNEKEKLLFKMLED